MALNYDDDLGLIERYQVLLVLIAVSGLGADEPHHVFEVNLPYLYSFFQQLVRVAPQPVAC
jgi:hypothetical protein